MRSIQRLKGPTLRCGVSKQDGLEWHHIASRGRDVRKSFNLFHRPNGQEDLCLHQIAHKGGIGISMFSYCNDRWYPRTLTVTRKKRLKISSCRARAKLRRVGRLIRGVKLSFDYLAMTVWLETLVSAPDSL